MARPNPTPPLLLPPLLIYWCAFGFAITARQAPSDTRGRSYYGIFVGRFYDQGGFMIVSSNSSPPAASAESQRGPALHCPKCGSARIHRSRRQSLLDHALAGLGAHLRRCHDCRSRRAWFGVYPLPVWDATAAKLAERGIIASAAVAGLVVC